MVHNTQYVRRITTDTNKQIKNEDLHFRNRLCVLSVIFSLYRKYTLWILLFILLYLEDAHYTVCCCVEARKTAAGGQNIELVIMLKTETTAERKKAQQIYSLSSRLCAQSVNVTFTHIWVSGVKITECCLPVHFHICAHAPYICIAIHI